MNYADKYRSDMDRLAKSDEQIRLHGVDRSEQERMAAEQHAIEMRNVEKIIVALFDADALWNCRAVTVQTAINAVRAISSYTYSDAIVQEVLTKLARGRVLHGYMKQGKKLYESRNCKAAL